MGNEIDRSSQIQKRIRVRKEDSAYLYALLESYEGVASYSTLPHQTGDLFRDLELSIPSAFVTQVEELLQSLGEMIHEI